NMLSDSGLGGKTVDDRMTISLARLENRRGKIRLVRRVGKMLRLHAETVALLINPAALAGEDPLEEIAGIKLHPGSGGKHFEHPAGGWFVTEPSQANLPRRFVEDEIVIVTLAELKLRVGFVDARADGSGFAEIKRRAFDGRQFACGNQRRAYGSV